MFTKLTIVILYAVSFSQLVGAQDIDFIGNASRDSFAEIMRTHGPQSRGKGTVEVFSDDNALTPVIPTKDRYGTQQYRFTPGKTRAKIKYSCKDAPIDQPPWQVAITIPARHPEVAGHDHVFADIMGSQACKKDKKQTCKPEPPVVYSWLINDVPWSPTTTTADSVISPMLSKDAVFTLVVNIPQYATQMITHVDFINCGGAEVDYLDIRVPDLTELPQSSAYISTGDTKLHPFNHYGTVTTVETLVGLANKWKQDHPGANRLTINDMSLKWGGRFDVFGNWSGSHSNHSFGFAADVSKKCVRKSNRGALILLMDKYGFDVWSEGEKLKEQNHFHIQHRQELARLRAINFPIEPDGRMTGDAAFEDDAYNNNGDGIEIVPPPPPASRIITDCVALMKKYYPNPPYNCNKAKNSDGTLGDGITQPYCKCINLYKVTGSTSAPNVELIPEENIEPPGCDSQTTR